MSLSLLVLGLLLLVLGDDGGHVGDDLSHVAHSLSPAFPEYQALSLLQEFWVLDESETEETLALSIKVKRNISVQMMVFLVT